MSLFSHGWDCRAVFRFPSLVGCRRENICSHWHFVGVQHNQQNLGQPKPKFYSLLFSGLWQVIRCDFQPTEWRQTHLLP